MSGIDKMDEKIIEFLLREGPVPNVVIANGLKTSEATVRRRRTRLEKEGFIKFVCAADPVKLGYNAAAIIGIEALTSKIAHVEAELQKLDDVQFLGLSTGGYDLMLEVWLRSPRDDIVRFTTETLARIDGILRSDVFLLTRLSKYKGWGGVFGENADFF
jgi:Lrp/AsnC family transcriptional regulator for asnA, asnC and gidA